MEEAAFVGLEVEAAEEEGSKDSSDKHIHEAEAYTADGTAATEAA